MELILTGEPLYYVKHKTCMQQERSEERSKRSEKDEDDILGVADLDTEEGDGSSQEDGMSSGVTRDTFLPGSPGLEGV